MIDEKAAAGSVGDAATPGVDDRWALEVRNVSHWYGEKKILNQVSLQISPGQMVALVGPSGCGKSTLLRAILGTHPPRQGEIWTNGHRVLRPHRDVGIVYQHYGLYDFLTALDNVAFGLMLDETSLPFRAFMYPRWRSIRKVHRELAYAMLEKVGLTAAAQQYPHQMSGGMRQRVAVAQSLVMKPQILLLDEPFGALDESTREDLQVMLLHLYQENLAAKRAGERPPYTVLIVTHELNEAIYVGDRVVGLSQYHLDGKNGATVVYDRPAPIEGPNDPRDFESFHEQKEELRRVVFDPAVSQPASDFVTFWKDHAHAAVTPGAVYPPPENVALPNSPRSPQ
ncbi:MAG: ATP-binding cassette domain-containing protein [Planctomycetota bacterium]|nr:ATP-binding cassette domain-containing protein [Planctomycetota bacterium]MDA1179187.1 ATP-binding cassette domain-containing protein [Planctomycetota bacterium]